MAGPPSNEQLAVSIFLPGEEQLNVISRMSAAGTQTSSSSVEKNKALIYFSLTSKFKNRCKTILFILLLNI